ncbi:hypothetical protein PENPOL_c003G00195 [Penicillium polonicum]|uniref:Clr5 domain-containing protein n=1 Tax=Penicillium polonicum TaxID=60169 RepID=A0A1V6NT94_PENPO|nr:hypothetical protein PENPOL_c003G00195 [Penicillium polonicum]
MANLDWEAHKAEVERLYIHEDKSPEAIQTMGAEVTTYKTIQTLNEEQLELLLEIRVRCDERAYARGQIMEEGCSILHTLGMVISLTYRNGCPWPNFLWALEQRMMILANEMVALGASDEYDQDIARML